MLPPPWHGFPDRCWSKVCACLNYVHWIPVCTTNIKCVQSCLYLAGNISSKYNQLPKWNSMSMDPIKKHGNTPYVRVHFWRPFKSFLKTHLTAIWEQDLSFAGHQHMLRSQRSPTSKASCLMDSNQLWGDVKQSRIFHPLPRQILWEAPKCIIYCCRTNAFAVEFQWRS